jgi:hypothetical protein
LGDVKFTATLINHFRHPLGATSSVGPLVRGMVSSTGAGLPMSILRGSSRGPPPRSAAVDGARPLPAVAWPTDQEALRTLNAEDEEALSFDPDDHVVRAGRKLDSAHRR